MYVNVSQIECRCCLMYMCVDMFQQKYTVPICTLHSHSHSHYLSPLIPSVTMFVKVRVTLNKPEINITNNQHELCNWPRPNQAKRRRWKF